MSHAQLAALAAITYASFIVGVWVVFRKAEPDPAGLVVLKVSALVAALVYVVAIAGSDATRPLLLVSACGYLASLVLFTWAAVHTRERRLTLAFNTDRPTFVLTSGPWRWVRHPFYASYLLSYVAGCVGSGQWWTVAMLVWMLGVYAAAARREELKFVASDLRHEWEAWRARTGMFVPRPWA